MRDSFVFYRSFFEAIATLNSKQRDHLFCAICDFALNEIEPVLTGVEKSIFELVRPQLSLDYQRYMNGKKGGAPKGNRNAKKTTENQPTNNQKSTENQPVVEFENNRKSTYGCFEERETEEEQEKETPHTPKKIEQEKEKEKEVTDTPSIACACACEGQAEFVTPMKQFIERWGINTSGMANYGGGRAAEVNWALLDKAVEKSTYLQSQKAIGFYIKHYHDIVDGYYDDFKKGTTVQDTYNALDEWVRAKEAEEAQ